ncbi:UDP-glucose 6-dehydrogenase ywqF [Rickettsiales bacterium Ac37b]|nr:UDP-glucose 6-dehydrogenase ywqF [Rickettsiales bacterium Ac37b]
MIKIGILGTGYVGLVTGVGLAELGLSVVCIDHDEEKIQKLLKGEMPIYEPGLEELAVKNFQAGRLFFTTKLSEVIEGIEVLFIAVGTPAGTDGMPDLCYIEQVIEELKSILTKDIILVIKSTVPVGTNTNIRQQLQTSSYKCHLVSNPEFLREGYAIHDFMYPSRIVIGTVSEEARKFMLNIYSYFSNHNIPIVCTTPETAELSKYASNSFLATKIAFINEMANLCEELGADVQEVAHIMGLDERIGSQFLQAGPGFGGSCFPKDIMALNTMGKKLSLDNHIIESVIKSNNMRKKYLSKKIIDIASNKKIACLGLTFKAGTDDIRDSSAIDIIKELLSYNLKLNLYDPEGMDNAKKFINNLNVFWADSAMQAISNAEVIVIFTEWAEFKNIDFKSLSNRKVKPIIIDLRNLLDHVELITLGFEYYGVGK